MKSFVVHVCVVCVECEESESVQTVDMDELLQKIKFMAWTWLFEIGDGFDFTLAQWSINLGAGIFKFPISSPVITIFDHK